MSQEQWEVPDELLRAIDRSGPVPVYQQLAGVLERAIHDQLLPAGSRLENEVALSDRLGLSRPTVRQAIQELVDKGLLVRRRGVGTTVVHGQVMRGVELTSLYEDLEQMGQSPETRVLVHEVVDADDAAAAALGIPRRSPVLHLRRLRLADHTPIAVLDNVLPGDFTDITADQLTADSLYQVLRERGVTMRVAKQKIGARGATAPEAQLLEIRSGAAVLTATRTAFDALGRAVEFGQHCYLADRYSFEVTLVSR